MRIVNAATCSRDNGKPEAVKSVDAGDKRGDKAFVSVMDDVRSQIQSPPSEKPSQRVTAESRLQKGKDISPSLTATGPVRTRCMGTEVTTGQKGAQFKKRAGTSSEPASPTSALPAGAPPALAVSLPNLPVAGSPEKPDGNDNTVQQSSKDAASPGSPEECVSVSEPATGPSVQSGQVRGEPLEIVFMDGQPDSASGIERVAVMPVAGAEEDNAEPARATRSGDQTPSADASISGAATESRPASSAVPMTNLYVGAGVIKSLEQIIRGGESLPVQNPHPAHSSASPGREAGDVRSDENGAGGAVAPATHPLEPTVIPPSSPVYTTAGESNTDENPGQKMPSPVRQASEEYQENGAQSLERDAGEWRISVSEVVQSKELERLVEPDRQVKTQGAEASDVHVGWDLSPSKVAQAAPSQLAAPGSVSRPPDFIIQLAGRMQVQIQSGGGELRLQLKPENLGRLEIRAESGASGVVARIVTESDAVKHYLENNLHTLHQSLQDQGLKIERIDVTVQDGLEARQFAGQQQSNHAGQQHDHHRAGSNMTSSDGTAGKGDLIAVSGILPALGPNTTFHTIA